MIVTRAPLPFPITEPSQVGEARRQILATALAIGLDADQQGKLALVVNELGTNLVKHGSGGELIARVPEGPPAVELLALDRGAGMGSVAECFRDGYSTAGSQGTGLGAIGRLAARVDVYSTQPGGTAIVALVGADAPLGRLETGAVSVPRAGEEVCGDAWAVAAAQECPALMVVDGLGHGHLGERRSLERCLEKGGECERRRPCFVFIARGTAVFLWGVFHRLDGRC